MLSSLVYVTGNLDKLKETKKYIHINLIHKQIDLPEIQSLNVEDIITEKAKHAYNIIHQPVLIEDVSLTFLALGKLPGTLIKWFLQELGCEGLCNLLNHYTKRSAIAQVTFGFYDGKILRIFENSVNGSIAKSPQGEGFGWTNIFIPHGYTKTWGEMTEDEKSNISLRKPALEKLETYLQTQK